MSAAGSGYISLKKELRYRMIKDVGSRDWIKGDKQWMDVISGDLRNGFTRSNAQALEFTEEKKGACTGAVHGCMWAGRPR